MHHAANTQPGFVMPRVLQGKKIKRKKKMQGVGSVKTCTWGIQQQLWSKLRY